MTQVGDVPPIQPQPKVPPTEARQRVDENMALPAQPRPSNTTTQGLNVVKRATGEAAESLEARVEAAALGDVVNALQDMAPEDTIESCLEEIEPGAWPQSAEEIFLKLDALHELSQRKNLTEDDKEALRDAFDQISTLAAKRSNPLRLEKLPEQFTPKKKETTESEGPKAQYQTKPMVEGAHPGYWETEIPNLSFLKKQMSRGHPPVEAGSMLEKITQTAEEIRKQLHINGGEHVSDAVVSPRQKTSPKLKRAVSIGDFDDLAANLSKANLSMKDILQAKDFLLQKKGELSPRLPRITEKYNTLYKSVLDSLWRLHQAGNQAEKAAVKEVIETLELGELISQSIVHKDIKILCLFGFEEPDKKASLINYLITDYTHSDLQSLLEAGLDQNVNQRDEELKEGDKVIKRELPLDKAIMEGKLAHLEILLNKGADATLLNKEEKARLLEKIESLLTQQGLSPPHRVLLEGLKRSCQER